MPVPKGKQEEYGKILGHMINLGKSTSQAKDIADRAVAKPQKKKSSKGSKKKVR